VRKPTLQQVADVAGVSITTASRVLNNGKHADRISVACSSRVKAVARDLGYATNYHHRSLRTGRAEALGIALEIGQVGQTSPVAGLIGNPYFHGLISGVEAATHEAGYALTLLGPHQRASAAERGLLALRQRRLDALVVPGVVRGAGLGSIVSESPELPVVVIQARVPTQLPTIDFDIPRAAAMIMEHLAGLGHREVLWVGEDVVTPNAREQVMMRAAWDRGLRGTSCRFQVIDPSTGVQGIIGHPEDVLAAHASAAVEKYVAQHQAGGGGAAAGAGGRMPFTAVIGYNDATAIGAMRGLMKRGLRVPQDASVVGFDNATAPLAFPPLTTIDHRFGDLGRRAGRLAIDMAVGGEERRLELRGHREVLEPLLVVRESTGPVVG
jgi:LacI family transcriptional regulator